MKYTYPSALGNAVSEHIWLWGPISKILGEVHEQTNKQTEATTLYIYIVGARQSLRVPDTSGMPSTGLKDKVTNVFG